MRVLSRNSRRNLGIQETAGYHGIVKKSIQSVKLFWNRYAISFKSKMLCHIFQFLIFVNFHEMSAFDIKFLHITAISTTNEPLKDIFQEREYYEQYSETRR